MNNMERIYKIDHALVYCVKQIETYRVGHEHA